jgi:hypothetical protein
LHCEKPRDKNRYHLLGSGFYAELEKYIRKISKTAALVFKGVHFPYIDPRDETDDILILLSVIVYKNKTRLLHNS